VVKKHCFEANISDEVNFRLCNKYGIVIDIMVIHLDETLGGGTLAFHNVMETVSQDLKIGAKETGSFHHKGLRVSTVPRGKLFAIAVDGDEYLDCTVSIAIPANAIDTAVLSPSDITNFRSVAGCIGYIASAF
jgi:hypothetical protein